MNRLFTGLMPFLLTVIVLSSCKTISSFVHDDKVVARVGTEKLYLSELEQYIPSGLSAEDSSHFALQYINSWAQEKLFMNLADKELTKTEKDVTRELEDYKASLLKFRFEQKYVNQRLDTAITSDQVAAYYESHPESFKLDIPIVRARFMTISADSPNLEILKKKMASTDVEELVAADSIAFSSTVRYTDYKNAWIDVVTLARDFGTDYVSLFSMMKNGYIEKEEENGYLNIAYIAEMKHAGIPGPIEYYDALIRDILLNIRKQELLSRLERDLIDKAHGRKEFVIY